MSTLLVAARLETGTKREARENRAINNNKLENKMKLPKDYADRTSLFADLSEIEDHWHRECADSKIGKLAAFIAIVVLGITLSLIYSKSSPAAVNTVSCFSLVDQAGEE